MDPASVPDSSTAFATMVERTVARSSVEFTACVTSPRARSSPTDCASSWLRVSSSWVRSSTFFSKPAWGSGPFARQAVELVGVRFEPTPGLDSDALAGVAAPEPCGTQPQRLDRADHAAGEKHPGQRGDEKRG